MKNILLLIVVLITFSIASVLAQPKGYVNPSAVYCEKMGYQYENRIDSSGNSNGVCILPNDSVVDAWDFFRGKVATEYSYCEKMGYKTQYTKVENDGYVSECAVCVGQLKKGGEVRIPMTDLMEQNGEPLITNPQKKNANLTYEKAKPSNLKEAGTIPGAFDWRSYNGHSYIGGVRNQGSCGSCYAFGANACAEGTFNFANGLYDANCIDLSESFIIWCLGSISPYSDHFSGCQGADFDYVELQALCDSGVCYESSFPYTGSDPGSCTHWNDDRIKMNDWFRVDCSDTTGIKTAIMTYGVVDAAVYVTSSFDGYSGGIFTDSYTSCSSSPCYYTATNHAIGLVGWGHDATYGLYWILRNSWGSSWGESGYMRIKWNAARVACEVCYMDYVNPDVNNPSGLNAVPVSKSEIDLTWNPNLINDPVLIAWSPTSTFGTPENGVTYSAGNSIPGGGTVLYYGTSTIYNHTSLSAATTYYYKAWSNTSGTYSTGIISNAATSCGNITSFPWNEGFENGGSIPNCWTQEQVSSSGVSWTFVTGNGSGHPTAAHGGTYNACLKDGTSTDNKTRMISPALNLNLISSPTLTFWHTQALWSPDQDKLTVYYKTTADGTWTQLTTYTTNISVWTQETILLPNSSSTYYINFEGNAKWGYGVCIDDVAVTGTPVVPATLSVTNQTVNNGTIECFDATNTITVAGGGTNVDFLSGSTVDLIAGVSIAFLPGFYAHEGCYMEATITTEAAYCFFAPAATNPVAENGAIYDQLKSLTQEDKPNNKLIKIFPNPNNGKFVIELIGFEGSSEITITNTMGAVIQRSTIKGDPTCNLKLSNVPSGIYFVSVKNGETIKNSKIVIR